MEDKTGLDGANGAMREDMESAIGVEIGIENEGKGWDGTGGVDAAEEPIALCEEKGKTSSSKITCQEM